MATPAVILDHRILYGHPDWYCAWPALVQAANGDLLLSFIRTRHHLYPDGAVVTMRSTDHGETWSAPAVAYDTPIDDRECGLTVLPDGRIAMHVSSTFWQAEQFSALAPGSYPPELIAAWIRQVNEPAYRAAAHHRGSWIIVSADHGRTWSAPKPGPDSIHGGIAVADGTLLVATYRNDGGAVGIYAAAQPEGPWTRRAQVWGPLAEIYGYGEPHLAQLPSGRIVLMIRATARQYDDRRDDLQLWESVSDDGGHTWTTPARTPLLGFPPHLTVLRDGRLLCTFGYRRAPFGQRAALSRDGVTWSADDVVVLRDDSGNHDLGYPASIEIAPGTILSVYYQKPAFDPADIHRHKPAIMATRWRVPGG
ncbi:MAG: sialidase family protein [Opitutales bacterium]